MQLGAPEIILILVIALLVFGPSKIPEIGRALGRSLVEFREGMQGSKKHDDHSDPPQT